MNSKRSSFTPSASVIDREYTHQVALPDDICTQDNFTIILEFFLARGWRYFTRNVQAIWPNGKYQSMRLYCFADRASAEAFQAHFGGEFFDPAHDRDDGRIRGAWRRDGVWTRLLESGPLKVPKILRD
ncbi:hypothetical protein G6N74_26965 [Mesorhizobium sp. CGMCC 1.15528]|uniref:Uncharacterized protein n=1 Tax=Mesorhizobium zhangyense TaxID=1776730 RepID=A0A7C9VBH8_9HYPH|nr:hypothetical protein [Mesorhizobium zhangyense]NGN44703.1 hypothetical protein [Mesorhizobium zhangyense]